MHLQRLKATFKTQNAVKLATGYLLALIGCLLAAPFFLPGLTANTLDLSQPYLAPFTSGNHWLGTDQLGRDVGANLLYGCQTAFLVAIPVSVLAFLVGGSLGMAAAWFGNKKLQVTYASLIVWPVCFFAAWFFGFYIHTSSGNYLLQICWLAGIFAGSWLLFRLLKTLPFLAKKVAFPLDELLLKAIEILGSVPRLILVLTFAAFLSPGISNVIILLSLTYWISPARLARAETLKLKQLLYIEAARSSGLPVKNILFRHILPNAAPPLITAFCFALSGLLALEATLSFLGIGLPPETPSWGRMLAGARMNPEAWWLIFFPSLFLCATILAIQTLGNALKKNLNTLCSRYFTHTF